MSAGVGVRASQSGLVVRGEERERAGGGGNKNCNLGLCTLLQVNRRLGCIGVAELCLVVFVVHRPSVRQVLLGGGDSGHSTTQSYLLLTFGKRLFKTSLFCRSRASEDMSQPGDMEKLRHAFDELDADGDGHITTEELQHALTPLNGGVPPSLALVKAMIADLNADGNGSVEFPEFCANQESLPEGLSTSNADPTARLKTTFNVFDRNGNGFISPRGRLSFFPLPSLVIIFFYPSSLFFCPHLSSRPHDPNPNQQTLLRALYGNKESGEEVTPADAKRMHAEADLNQDGKVSFEEFVRLMQKNG